MIAAGILGPKHLALYLVIIAVIVGLVVVMSMRRRPRT
jgi:uncharacterized membrane protein